MWQILLAAAVAGSTGFATQHFLSHHHHNNQPQQQPRTSNNSNVNNDDHDKMQDPDEFSDKREGGDGVFTFSSSQSLAQCGSSFGTKKNRASSKNRVGVPNPKAVRISDAEVRYQHGRRLPFCLKKRKTSRNSASKSAFCSSSKDNSLFGWGLGFGIMYMMSAGKAEINKLNKTMDEAAIVVQELKSELNRRKSPCPCKFQDPVGNMDTNSHRTSGRNDELMVTKTNNELRNTDAKIWSPALNDGGECGSSTLTEEPEPRVQEMDQLEAELKFELQKLSGGTIDTPCHEEEIRPKLDKEEGCDGSDDLSFNHSQSRGVSPFELNQKLSCLLIKQQENQITELESELHIAQSSLYQKEVELQSLKECVGRLTELSLSRVSDDETLALTDPKGTSNIMDSESKQTVVGVKRPIDSESSSCSYYM